MSKSPKPSSTAIYTRISLDREATQLGVARQERLCRQLCDERGWSVLGEQFSDPSTSALQRKHRPGFEALREAIKANRVTRVVVWHPDRLTRNMAELESLIALLDAHNINVETVTAGTYDLSTPSGRMTARILGAVAAQESEHKGERVSAKHEELARAGKRAGGRRTYGYIDATCREVEPADFLRHQADPAKYPDPAIVAVERAAATEAMTRILAGESVRSICGDFNRRGLRTTEGALWDNSLLRQRIMRPTLAGIRTYKGREYPGAWKPAVDVALWRRAVALLSSPERSRRQPAVPYLLNGLAHTAAGERMVGMVKDGRAYRGPGVHAHEGDLDLIVTRAVFAYLADGLAGDVDPSEAERSTLVARRDALLANMKKLDDKAAREPESFNFDAWEALTNPMREQVRDLTAQLDAMTPVSASLAETISRPGALEAAWPEMTRLQQREAMRLVLRAVVVAPATTRGKAARLLNHPERVTYDWRLAKPRRRKAR